MRTYGRTSDLYGRKTWRVVQTDAQGNDAYVWVTTLAQCLLLNRGESPFWADHGIPAQQSLVQQFFPDFYVSQTQRQFASYFASLVITKLAAPAPLYDVRAMTFQGVPVAASIPV